MTAQEIRQKYLKFFEAKQHAVIPRALLVPQNDPTTLFTGSGMQPLIPYLLGEEHPKGKRLVDSQTCLRAQDIEEVGDNRHTTFFEMLGNWSLGDYFKAEQLPWFFEFLTKEVGLDANKLYVTCFIGDKAHGLPKDTESADIWKGLFKKAGVEAKEADMGSEAEAAKRGIKPGERILYYDAAKNWWCRSNISDMPVGEPGGGDSEVFYDFGAERQIHESSDFKNQQCHPNCDCGRFIEIGNSVFMEYVKTDKGFEKLPKQNVDFGGGLERIAQAAIDSPDMFKISVLWPIVEELEKQSNKNYESHTENMRVIADHLRGAFWLAIDGVTPSNKAQGYVMRRLIRRAIRYAFELGVEQDLAKKLGPVIVDIFKDDYPEVKDRADQAVQVLEKEEKVFRQTLRKGLKKFEKKIRVSRIAVWEGESGIKKEPKTAEHDWPINELTGDLMFELYDTDGFPVELSKEEAYKRGVRVADDADEVFERLMQEQRKRSQTASAGQFKGGLADHSELTTKYHTATHLMYRALRNVLGDHVVQRGSNITEERLRFDFSHPEKMTDEEIAKVEEIVNQQIAKDWPVTWREENTKEALANGVLGAFGDKYGESVKVYTVGDPDGEHYSREICGGPHVEHTGALAEGDKQFKITKEESSSAGVRRIKAVLQ